MNTPLKSLRLIGFVEGISFIVLLVIAMPLKYLFDMPLAVSIVGALHGALFVLYIAAIIYVMITVKWSLLKAFLAALASVIPFGPFLFDGRLFHNEK
jgi:integral membrane protein